MADPSWLGYSGHRWTAMSLIVSDENLLAE
jgi:hypothetical protein